jgi:hypothetical protein
MIGRTGLHWSEAAEPFFANINPSTSRNQNWSYDADGRPTAQENRLTEYDAAGLVKQVVDTDPPADLGPILSVNQKYDGDGQPLNHVENDIKKYYMRSSVSGQVVSELGETGQFLRGYVYLEREMVAKQESGAVTWVHTNPITGSENRTQVNGGFAGFGTVLDPLGVDTWRLNWYLLGQRPGRDSEVNNQRYTDPFSLDLGCMQNFMPGSCLEPNFQFWGDRIADLPGFGTMWGSMSALAEWSHSQRVTYTNGRNGIVRPRPEGGSLFETEYQQQQRRIRAPQNPREPQGTFDDAYKGCLGDLGKSTAPGLAQTDRILDVANKTGVDPTLLAVTWRFEGSLDQYGEFNFQPTNGFHTRGTNIGDVGPGQLHPPIWNKSPYTDGLNNPFGTNLNTGQVFNGNAFQNLMVTGRALGRARGDQRADAAGYYRAGNHSDSRYRARVQNFKEHGRNYDRFFECLAKKGFSP